MRPLVPAAAIFGGRRDRDFLLLLRSLENPEKSQGEGQQGKRFFFEKKKQKTFVRKGFADRKRAISSVDAANMGKRFLVLFLKKNIFGFLPLASLCGFLNRAESKNNKINSALFSGPKLRHAAAVPPPRLLVSL